jgi:ubiquitin-activating enzyme E1
LTDHCIEWARDQFELLFSKISKTFEAYVVDPISFEEKIKSKAESEPGSAYFDIRSVTSFARLVSNPSIFNAAQLSFDIFHFLFRDKILDLQHAFPINTRMIDEKTNQDKGPFCGEKKRYPTVAKFDPNDESHTSFMLSATCLFSVIVGLIPQKDENDANWLKEYRSAEWIVNIVSTLTPPAYIQAPVNSEGIENAPKVDKQLLYNIVENLLSDLRNITSNYLKQKANGSKAFETIEFEKDDDSNFHVDFMAAVANLRARNYKI